MTFEVLDGFDHYASDGTGAGVIATGKWNYAQAIGQFGSFITDDGRGGRCFRLNGNSTNSDTQGLVKTLSGTVTEVMISAYHKWSSLGFGVGTIIPVWATAKTATAYNASLALDTDTKLFRAYRNGWGVNLANGSFVYTPDTWVHLELYIKIDGSVGRVVLKINGSATPDIDFTGNTLVAGGGVDFLGFGMPRGDLSGHKYLDDVYIRSGVSTFLGKTRVRTLFPRAAGASTGLTPTPVLPNYVVTQDAPDDGDSTYVEGAAAAKDTYAFSDLKPLDVPLFVQTNIDARKTDGATRQIKTVTTTSSEVDGATKTLAATYAGYREQYATDPADASAWTKLKIDAAEFGALVVA